MFPGRILVHSILRRSLCQKIPGISQENSTSVPRIFVAYIGYITCTLWNMYTLYSYTQRRTHIYTHLHTQKGMRKRNSREVCLISNSPIHSSPYSSPSTPYLIRRKEELKRCHCSQSANRDLTRLFAITSETNIL